LRSHARANLICFLCGTPQTRRFQLEFTTGLVSREVRLPTKFCRGASSAQFLGQG
jgi:hypothetical protein